MREDLPEGTGLSFEDYRHENGHTFWWASDLQRMLAYDTWKSFFKVIAKAQKLLASIEVPVSEHILASERVGEEEGLPVQDFKLTRFACLVIVMQADAGKPEVARGAGASCRAGSSPAGGFRAGCSGSGPTGCQGGN